MNPFLVGAGIRFVDCVFSEPRRLVDWIPPKCAGIMVILVRDPNWAPKQFQPLRFWEFDAGTDLLSLSHLPHIEALFVATLALPCSTSPQRAELLNKLAWAYKPAWQGSAISSRESELARKLNDLERKHEEQTTQFRLLLASINRLLEPQTAPPRRRTIGFSPAPVENVESRGYTSLKFADTRA